MIQTNDQDRPLTEVIAEVEAIAEVIVEVIAIGVIVIPNGITAGIMMIDGIGIEIGTDVITIGGINIEEANTVTEVETEIAGTEVVIALMSGTDGIAIFGMIAVEIAMSIMTGMIAVGIAISVMIGIMTGMIADLLKTIPKSTNLSMIRRILIQNRTSPKRTSCLFSIRASPNPRGRTSSRFEATGVKKSIEFQ